MRLKPILILLALLAWTAAAHAGDATDAVKGANQKLRDLLGQKVDAGSDAEQKLMGKVTTELRDLLDIGDLARRALVDHWAGMTQGQRDQIVDILRLVIERSYLTQLRTNLDYTIEYGAETAKGDDVQLATVIKAESKGRQKSIAVDYVLHRDGKRWRVVDVVTDEVSLLANYRSQFNRIIGKDGVDGLIARMKKKADAK